MSNEVLTVRARIRATVRVLLTDVDSASLPDVAREATDRLMEDTAFLQNEIRDLVQALAYEEARALAQSTRSNLIVMGDEVMTRQRANAALAAKRASRWERWLEHVGDHHVKLLYMTREELIAAAKERRGRADTEMRVANLWDALADKLEGGQRVGERFTTEEIETMRQSLERGDHGKGA